MRCNYGLYNKLRDKQIPADTSKNTVDIFLPGKSRFDLRKFSEQPLLMPCPNLWHASEVSLHFCDPSPYLPVAFYIKCLFLYKESV